MSALRQLRTRNCRGHSSGVHLPSCGVCALAEVKWRPAENGFAFMKLVLASSSPYRRALLSRLGLPFEAASPGIDETARPGEEIRTLVCRLALEKARALAGSFPAALIIGSDQACLLHGQILGKPHTFERA